MKHSDNIDKIAPALVKLEAELDPVYKDSENPFFKSTYADHSSVVKASKKQLADNGLAITQGWDFDEAKGWAVETVLMHESGQWISFHHPAEPIKKDPQGFASATTYGRRIGHMGIIGMTATDDDDGNEASKGHDKKHTGNVTPIKNPEPKGQHGMLGDVKPPKPSNTDMPLNATMMNNLISACKKNDIPWQKVVTFTKKEYHKDPNKISVIQYESVMKLISTGAL